MSDREEILAEVNSVPALPMAASKVIEMIREPDVGVADVMEVVEYDPGLTSNVLRLANSAYFGGNREIVSLRDAGVRLGLNRVFQLVMTSAISKVVSQPVRGYSLSPGELLEHSMAVAIGAEQLACALDRQPPPETFTTALKRVGQISRQVPHLVHLSWSITCTILLPPDIASAGQPLRQMPHPSHLSGRI